METAIETRNLSVGYGTRHVLDNIDMTIPAGSVSVLIGANGTGKSTLLRTLGAAQPVLAGSIAICGEDIGQLSRHRLARLLSIVYTDRALSGGLTVSELVGMGRHPHTGFFGHLSADDRDAVVRAMEQVGISHKAAAFLSDISDGERQKAMIARAVAQDTPVMLLDEPTSYLDAASRLEILALIRRLSRERNMAVILSTHDTSAALGIADKVITVVPDPPGQMLNDKRQVVLQDINDPALATRLNAVFSDRGVCFDPTLRDFALRSE